MANEHDDNNDDVEKRAAAISKELGADGKVSAQIEEEEIPNYEVVVEEDQPDDERLVKGRNADAAGGGDSGKSERKVLSNKEKRELRKKKIASKFGEKDEEIASLRAENQEFKNWRNQVEGKLANVDRQKLDEAINITANKYKAASDEYATAFTEGDGVKATAAMEKMYDAKKDYEKLDGMKKTYDANPPRQPAANTGAKPDQRVINKGQAWAERNKEWFKFNGTDEDSAMATAMSGTLQSEGFDPTTDDFWDELDDRLEKRNIGKVSRKEEEDYEEEEEKKPAVQRKRSSPPVGGGSGRGDVGGGQRKLVVPTAYINHLKDKGWWDDIPMRNKMLKKYEENKKRIETNG